MMNKWVDNERKEEEKCKDLKITGICTKQLEETSL